MVADTDPTVPRQVPLALRMLVTLVLLGLFQLGGRVPLPLINPEIRSRLVSIVALDVRPLLTGFVAVELLALFVPFLRRLRHGGRSGRWTLNRIALGVSVAVSVVQSGGIALFLEHSPRPVITDPGLGFRFLLVCTLAAATAAIYVLGNLITAWGIGNGFCLLTLLVGMQKILHGLPDHSFRPVDDRTGLSLLVLVFLSILFLRRVQRIGVSGHGETLALPVPAFPQTFLPLSVATKMPSMIALVLLLLGRTRSVERTGADAWLPLSILVLIPLLSLLLFSWLGSPKRLLGNLPAGSTLEPGTDSVLLRQLLLGIGVLSGGALLYFAADHYAGMQMGILTFSSLLFLVAIGLDLYDQVRFLSRYAVADVLELDNVHLALYLERRLAAHGIPVLVQGYQARSLFFLFQPLFKMNLQVPAERLAEARALVGGEDLRIV